MFPSVIAALACVITVASPAAADSSACTHHWSGPQICIRLEGHNGWNGVTAIWTNPPRTERARAVRLILDGHQLFRTETARRVGQTLSHHWRAFETATNTKVCVEFARIGRVACQTTRYTG